ncbi:hypothetical protein F5B20DRAFT_467198 [Whalleya microplaca]|nr:hypothetical protein F5B20DRAFT_467198 [Whalleya microplaca]
MGKTWQFFRGNQTSFVELFGQFPTNAQRCAAIVEKLSRIPRAFADLCEFKDFLESRKLSWNVCFIDYPKESSQKRTPPGSINAEISKLRVDYLLPVRKELKLNSTGRGLLRPHCEVQILSEFENLSRSKQSEFWKLIGCSKGSCFCCSYVIKAAGFQAAPSHGKVYYPWPLPKRFSEISAFPRGLDELLAALNQRLVNASAKGNFDEGDSSAESPSKIIHDWRLEWETMDATNATGETYDSSEDEETLLGSTTSGSQ